MSNRQLNIANVKVDKPEVTLLVGIIHLVNNKFSFIVTSDVSEWEKTLTFTINGEVVGEVHVDSIESIYHGNFWLSANFLDNKSHLVECYCKEGSYLIGSGLV